ncbi:MAG TPA: sensor histidine kinase, partial [Ilumatobacteraceae bacterium]|nr:sensor histidine kinase [Ilumatobacteraceae bacterium]
MTIPRRAVLLSALGIAVFQVIGTFGASSNQPDRKSVDALAIVLVLVGPVVLAVRDRWPLLAVAVSIIAADIYIALGYPFGPIFVSIVVALFAAVLAGRRRAATVLVAAGFLGFVGASVADPRTDGVALVRLALVAGWVTLMLAIAELVRVRRTQAAERHRAAAEEERRREDAQRLLLAQELHDVLAHNISMINVQASVALHLLDDRPEQARPALVNIKAASHDALRELRSALDVLRHGDDAPRAPAPTLADLDGLVDSVRAGGLDIHLQIDGPVQQLPSAVELAAYRIVQEALTNITRHARAHDVSVHVEYDDGVTIEVLDDGVGGSPNGGNGIVGMRERAIALGGSVTAGPRPGGGFL